MDGVRRGGTEMLSTILSGGFPGGPRGFFESNGSGVVPSKFIHVTELLPVENCLKVKRKSQLNIK